MDAIDHDITGAFMRTPCPDCNGTGELRMESENVNEKFEVEKQIVITACPRCGGTGSIIPEDEKTVQGGLG
jgi:DnaJ-class molecular chaperone